MDEPVGGVLGKHGQPVVFSAGSKRFFRRGWSRIQNYATPPFCKRAVLTYFKYMEFTEAPPFYGKDYAERNTY